MYNDRHLHLARSDSVRAHHYESIYARILLCGIVDDRIPFRGRKTIRSDPGESGILRGIVDIQFYRTALTCRL